MPFDVLLIVRVLIALIGTVIGAYFDIFNRKNVPNLFLYSFLAVSLFINVFDYKPIISTFIPAILIIAALYLLSRLGQIGMADVLLIASIYFALPYISNPILVEGRELIIKIPSIPSIFSILAISAILFAIFILVKYIPISIKKLERRN